MENIDKKRSSSSNADVRTDRRIIRTKRNIHRAFIELMSEKRLKDITIKDIADRADVNRKTFYNHYNNIYELIEEIETEIVETFDRAMEGINIATVLQDPNDLRERLLMIGNSFGALCEHLMHIEYDGKLVTKIAAALENSIRKTSGDQIRLDDDTVHMLMEFAVAGMLQTYQNWFNSDRSVPVEEVTERVSRIVTNGINGIKCK